MSGCTFNYHYELIWCCKFCCVSTVTLCPARIVSLINSSVCVYYCQFTPHLHDPWVERGAESNGTFSCDWILAAVGKLHSVPPPCNGRKRMAISCAVKSDVPSPFHFDLFSRMHQRSWYCGHTTCMAKIFNTKIQLKSFDWLCPSIWITIESFPLSLLATQRYSPTSAILTKHSSKIDVAIAVLFIFVVSEYTVCARELSLATGPLELYQVMVGSGTPVAEHTIRAVSLTGIAIWLEECRTIWGDSGQKKLTERDNKLVNIINVGYTLPSGMTVRVISFTVIEPSGGSLVTPLLASQRYTPDIVNCRSHSMRVLATNPAGPSVEVSLVMVVMLALVLFSTVLGRRVHVTFDNGAP